MAFQRVYNDLIWTHCEICFISVSSDISNNNQLIFIQIQFPFLDDVSCGVVPNFVF